MNLKEILRQTYFNNYRDKNRIKFKLTYNNAIICYIYKYKVSFSKFVFINLCINFK